MNDIFIKKIFLGGQISGWTFLDISIIFNDNITEMSKFFEHCSNLISLDFCNFDTSNITDMLYKNFKISIILSVPLAYPNAIKIDK